MDTERLINIIITVTVFGLVFAVWCICVFLWLGQYLIRLKAVQRRLGIVKEESDESRTLRLWRETYTHSETFHLPRKESLRQRLERIVRDAGCHAPVQTIILGVMGAAVLAFVITYLASGGILWGLGIAAATIAGFWTYTTRRISKRAALFERQLVDALGIAARALRAGHPLVGAFQLVTEEIAEPVGPIFAQVCREQTLGLDLKDSIRKVANNTHNAELKLFATSVAIQLKSGGNLADLMDSLADVIRARMRLNRRARIITAQTQFSKRILIGLPILLFFVLNLISPQYIESFYTTSIGKLMLLIAALSVLLGSWTMNKLAVTRF